MVGSGLKKFAQEKAMKISSGVAYGSLNGYATTLSEGSGWKRIDIATRFSDPEQRTALQQAINAVDISREYRIENLQINHNCINIIFQDNPGTMKKLRAFVDWFYPLLAQHNASAFTLCPQCGNESTPGAWYLINGIAYYLHPGCAQQLQQTLQQEQQQQKDQDTGSYLQGLVGAFLGAALGAVVWALVLTAGYFASIVGLLIGWLAEKGYGLFHGKQGKGKLAILIIVIILAVCLGTLAADGISLGQMIDAGELPGYTYEDIPLLIVYLLQVDSQYVSATLGNIAMGLVFAGLGVFALLKKTSSEISGYKMKKLD